MPYDDILLYNKIALKGNRKKNEKKKENDLNDLQIKRYTIFFIMKKENMKNVHQNAIMFWNKVAIYFHLKELHGHLPTQPNQPAGSERAFFLCILSA